MKCYVSARWIGTSTGLDIVEFNEKYYFVCAPSETNESLEKWATTLTDDILEDGSYNQILINKDPNNIIPIINNRIPDVWIDPPEGWFEGQSSTTKNTITCCCGSDATYGPKNTLHAFYCPKHL